MLHKLYEIGLTLKNSWSGRERGAIVSMDLMDSSFCKTIYNIIDVTDLEQQDHYREMLLHLWESTLLLKP